MGRNSLLSLPSILTTILCFANHAKAQGSCGPINTANSCSISNATPRTSSTVYFDPANPNGLQFSAQSAGCDAGSVAKVQLWATTNGWPSSLLAECGCMPLDGVLHTLTCNTPPTQGNIPEGSYEFEIFLSDYFYAYDSFSVVHTQRTVTAGTTPTETIVVEENADAVVTSTLTNTETETSKQITVTSPAITKSTVVTVKPPAVKTTTTKTLKFTATKNKVAINTVTKTRTAPCLPVKPTKCPQRGKSKRSMPMHLDTREILNFEKRAPDGDGPPVVTVAPNPMIVTSTRTITSTNTVFENTEVTTTVSPTPLTTTVYSGKTVNIRTTTLPAVTKIRTKYTVSVALTTKTKTFTVTRSAVVTPICK